MKRILQILIILVIIALAAGCSVKQNQLVVLERHDNPKGSEAENSTLNFNTMPQKISIENNSEILKKLDSQIIPLAVSHETGNVVGFSFIDSNETDETNSRIVTGNMLQPINLYVVDTNNNEKKLLGRFLSLKDFQLDETGRIFAFIDGNSNIYIYDMNDKTLQNIIEGKNYYSYNSLSWSRDSTKLLINQRMTLDISSKQLISYAVDAYNPFVEQKFNNQEVYIVQMKNKEFGDMIALYDFTNRSFKSLANGVFLDSDNISLIYTKQNENNLYLLNLETLESKSIEAGPIYSAKIMKSTGEILYTTMNNDLTSSSRYKLIKLNPASGDKKAIELSTPTFYLSPNEGRLYFVGDYNSNKITVATADLKASQAVKQTDDADLWGIKTLILKMFQLDYGFIGSYEEYENQAMKVYANTYDPVPQEALENKLIDFKRFNMPLPAWQKEPAIPPTIVLSSINVRGSKASVNIGLFFVNSLELARIGGNWMITGFSTHPESKEAKEARNIVQAHLSNIKNKNKTEALKFWKSDSNSEFDKAQLKIVEDLMKDSSNYKIEIGEIELWSLSEPHRSENSQTAIDAKVKIIINNKNNIQKYKLVLSKTNKGSFEIESWSTDPLSISQLH